MAWERSRQRRRIDTWMAQGVVDDALAKKLLVDIDAPREPTRPAIVVVPQPPPVEEPLVAAGIEALAELDEAPARPWSSVRALDVFWLIGAMLVLAGSVMGVREAWLTLEGVLRPLAIASALFGYHALFLVVARLLPKRVQTTSNADAAKSRQDGENIGAECTNSEPDFEKLYIARILAGIAVGLLPIAFVAGAVTLGQDAALGTPFVAALAVASIGTMLYAGSLGFGRASGGALAAGLAPSLGLVLVAGAGGASPETRLAVALAALAPAVIAALVVRRRSGAEPLVALGAAAYGALAVGATCLYGGPGDDVLHVATADVVTWLALAAAVAWCASRQTIVLRVVAIAGLAGTGLAAFSLALITPASVLPAGVVALAAVIFALEQRGRAAVAHLAVPAALAAGWAVSRAFLPTPHALVATAIIPAALLAWRRAPRLLAHVWGVVAALALLLALAFVASSPAIPIAGALGFALAAHVGRRHLTGAAFAFGGVLALALASRPAPLAVVVGGVAVIFAAAYGVAKRDDASLAFVLVGLGAGALAGDARIAVAIAAIAFVRARRDASALLVTLGAFALGLVLRSVTPAALALGFTALAALRRPKADDEPRFGRAIAGLVPLPLGGRGRSLFDGFALAALPFAAIAIVRALVRTDAESMIGLVLLAAAALLAFLTPAFDLFHARGRAATLVVVVLALGSAALVAVAFACDVTTLVGLVGREGPLTALVVAATAAAAHGLRLRIARDALLVASGAVLALFVVGRTDGGHVVGLAGVGALALGIAVALHAAATERTGRHVMLVEASLVALYAFLTRELDLLPVTNALAGLAYAFALLGVGIVAQRRGVAPVAAATRRFVSALPVILAVVATDTVGAIALGASVLYGAMAWLEKSRIYGSLAATAANVALLVFALAQGLDGIEIYVDPVGILVAALAQIYAAKTTHAVRTTLRVVAGALVYLPSAFELAMRLGSASAGTYSVVFGAACLGGVLVGVTLRIRAYLALGTGFLALDVLANLAHAGIHDHRVGFVLLSTTGLAILGAMILLTVRRDLTFAAASRVRLRLRAWD